MDSKLKDCVFLIQWERCNCMMLELAAFLHELAVSCVGWRAVLSLSLCLSLSPPDKHTHAHTHTHGRAHPPPAPTPTDAHSHTRTHTVPLRSPLTEGSQEVQPWPNYSVTPRADRCHGYVFPAVPWSVAPRKKVLSHQPSLRQQAKTHPVASAQLAVYSA